MTGTPDCPRKQTKAFGNISFHFHFICQSACTTSPLPCSYAALNLASLHARFRHRSSALSSLRECVTMAQEADDHACLLHALMWLLRIDDATDVNLSRMIDNFYQHSYETRLKYLEGVAHLNRAQFDVLHGEIQKIFKYCYPPSVILICKFQSHLGFSPWRVMSSLMFVDLLAGVSNNLELLTASFAQRSSLWSLYGRCDLSGLLAQLAMGMHSTARRSIRSDGSGGGEGRGGSEGVTLAMCSFATRLFNAGRGRACDKVLQLAR